MVQHDKMILNSFTIAARAREKGNMPFGALLADATGIVLLEAENTVYSENDCTAHAEINLIRNAYRVFAPEKLTGYTLYASTEPCPMCTGALFWSGIKCLVFGLSTARFFQLVDSTELNYRSCRDTLIGSNSIEIIGPLLEDEASHVHQGYWSDDQAIS